MPKQKKLSFFSKLLARVKAGSQKHPYTAGAIIVLCGLFVFALGCWKFEYHGESPQLISVQHQANKSNREQQRQFNRGKQDSYPTVQQAHDFLKDKFGVEPSSPKVSAKQINDALVDKYGKTAADLLQNGYCLSEVMTPSQEAQQEVLLARHDPDQTAYVGFNQMGYRTSIYHPDSIGSARHAEYNLNMSAAVPESGHLTYTNLKKNYQISDPVIMPFSMQQVLSDKKDPKNNGTLMMLMFIRVPTDKTTYRWSFNRFINSLDVTVDGKKAELTQGAGYSQGLQLSGLSNSANQLNLKKSYKIFRGSLVPVVFTIKPDMNKRTQLIHIKVNGNNLTPLMTQNNAQIVF